MRLNLLYQFNEKYVPYAGVSIYSILHHNKYATEICIYIMGENLSCGAKKKIERMATAYKRTVIFIDTEFLIDKMKMLDMPTYRGSYAANMRLFLDEVLDEAVEKVLYLDSDTIVTERLDELFQIDMQGKAIGMVLDSLGDSHKKQIGLSEFDDYYNSGVILFDLQHWRERKYKERIVQHVTEKRNNYPAPDQDLLNLVCKGDILRLNLKYNFQPIHGAFSDGYFKFVMRPNVYYDVRQIDAARKRTVIYHCFRFLGEFPWHKGNLHPFGGLFDRYLEHSPWKDYNKEKANVGFTIRIEKLLYRVLPKILFLPIFKCAHALFLYQSERDALKNKMNKLM